MARYGSLSVFLTGRSRVTVTWVNPLKSPATDRELLKLRQALLEVSDDLHRRRINFVKHG